MIRLCHTAAATFFTLLAAVAGAQNQAMNTFEEDVASVSQHTHLIVLSDPGGASIAVWPAMQGRVLTSTAAGPGGRSFGWINHDLINSGKVQEHFNAVGGEDRIWLGPEGGQYSIFFAPHAPFDLAHWFTPAPIDTEAFDIVSQTKSTIAFRKAFHLTNYSGKKFDVQIDREVRLLSREEIWSHLGLAAVSEIKAVGFESVNKLTNLAPTRWNKSSGLLSIWVLGQFQAAPAATIVLPLRNGPESELGIAVKTDYFGPVPSDRISIRENAVLFKADSNYRSKLGISPQRSRGLIGSYDPEHHVLTIVQYDQPEQTKDYVNSAWEIQKNPYQGDVANCYNDGPPAPGKPQLGHFYELESSSPASELASHQFLKHTQRTIHLVGTKAQLDPIAKAALGVSLTEVLAFNHQ